MKRHTTTLLTSASLIAVTIMGSATALAQDNGSQDTESNFRGLDEIVVTATRQETNLQETPIAVTAVTAETLEARGLTDAAALGNIVPNAAFRRAQGLYGPGVSAFIRGIGQHDTNLASEPGVAFYVDDIYYPLTLGSTFDLLELDHVEVLRGPQGTLFGRNALAGAINLVSKKPDTTDSSAFVKMTVGEFNRRDIRAGFNYPISDNAAIAITGISRQADGYMKRLDFRCEMIRRGTPELAGRVPFSTVQLINDSNVGELDDCQIGDMGGRDINAMRGQFVWEPAANLELFVTADYTEDNSTAAPDNILAIDPARSDSRANTVALYDQYTLPGGDRFRYDERFVTGDPFTTYATFRDLIPAGTDVPGSTIYNGSIFRGGIANPVTYPQENWGVSTKAIYGITENIDLTAILGYREYEATFAYDVDGGPIALENNRNDVTQTDLNGELRLSGSMDLVDWVVGAFYYEGEGNQRFVGTSNYNSTIRYQNNNYKPESKAVYANTTWHPIDRVNITLGGRYSDELKKVDFYSVLDGTDADSTMFETLPGGSAIFDLDITDERFDWKAGIDYELNDASLVYASAATGYRLPGFNSRPLQPSQATQYPGDETVAYELGLKTDVLDNRVRFNGAVFYTDYKTRPVSNSGQEALLDANGNPVPGDQVVVPSGSAEGVTTCEPAPAGTQGVTCIGRAFFVNTPGEVKGIEIEMQAEPVDRLRLQATMGYAKFTGPDIDARPDGASKRLQRIPEWTASAGAEYEFDITPTSTVTPRLDWFYQGPIDYHFNVNNDTYNRSGYSVFNGRVTYQNDEHDFSVAVGATNLFDKFYYENIFVYQDIGFPNVNGQPARPREWFVEVGKRF